MCLREVNGDGERYLEQFRKFDNNIQKLYINHVHLKATLLLNCDFSLEHYEIILIANRFTCILPSRRLFLQESEVTNYIYMCVCDT